MKKIPLILGVTFLIFAGLRVYATNNVKMTDNNNKELLKGTKETIQLKITGMTCAGCSSNVTQTLEGVKGVLKVDLEYPGDVATVEYDSKTTNKEELMAAVEKINYKVEEVKKK